MDLFHHKYFFKNKINIVLSYLNNGQTLTNIKIS